MNTEKELYIYIISHPLFEIDWYKLGRTMNLKNRLASYNTCCPNRCFKIEYYIKVSSKAAQNVERHFRYKVKGNKYEWFNLELSKFIETIENIVKISNENNKIYNEIKNKKIKNTKYKIDDIHINETISKNISRNQIFEDNFESDYIIL